MNPNWLCKANVLRVGLIKAKVEGQWWLSPKSFPGPLFRARARSQQKLLRIIGRPHFRIVGIAGGTRGNAAVRSFKEI
ncbi:MAG TPA: hypothetical protein VNK03_05815 [Gammaproteobacteria bacterium]|nr:hypothetical protein [Gammaproteobacteria bacterium]